jgi:hypothetical protein
MELLGLYSCLSKLIRYSRKCVLLQTETLKRAWDHDYDNSVVELYLNWNHLGCTFLPKFVTSAEAVFQQILLCFILKNII